MPHSHFVSADSEFDEDSDVAGLLSGTAPAALKSHLHSGTSLPPTSTGKLVATIVKSFIGSGVLFLPKAFQSGGWLFSIIVMVFMAIITQVTIIRLIACRQIVGGTYGQVVRAAVGPWGQVAVDTSLVLSQAGFCCVYIIFIAKNVMQLLNAHTCWLPGGYLWVLILLQWFLFTPLTWIRRIANFAPTNIAADALIAAGLVGVLAFSINGIASTPGPVQLSLFNSNEFSIFLGTAIYAYEGIGMVVPVFDSLAPVDQARFPRVLSATLAGVTAVYCVVGLVPYLYLDGMAHVPMQDSVTLNLPRVWWSFAIIGGYCLALTFSYPLMLHPAIAIIEGVLTHYRLLPALVPATTAAAADQVVHNDGDGGGHGPNGSARETARLTGGDGEGDGEHVELVEKSYLPRNAARGMIVALTLGVSLVGSQQLNNFVSLIGAFCCCPLAFIYPCVSHLVLVKNASAASKALDVAIIVFGVGVFVFSSYQAVAQWSVSPINPCVDNSG